MQVISRDAISAVLDKDAIISVVRDAFINHAKGVIQSPLPMHIEFSNSVGEYIGDCHVKSATSPTLPYFAVKLASGFYNNPAVGLPVNNGLVMLLSNTTGQPIALLQDDGLLTSYRTAAAGALAASLPTTTNQDVLGIIGTGHQAEQQALWICHHLGLKSVGVFGRSIDKAQILSNKLNSNGLAAQAIATVAELCEISAIVVTTTPAREPIVMSSDIQKPIHIVAMGSDIPGKQELDSKILKRASYIVNDDIKQCKDHGETGSAIRSGLIDEDKATFLGRLLADNINFKRDVISVVDLTGLGAQDLAIANLVAEKIGF